MNTTIKCRYCKAQDFTKEGYRKTEHRGKIQKYKCNSCGKYFTNDGGFYRMRNSPQKITLCLDLFYKGVSTRQVQQHLKAFYPHNSDYSTIYRWVLKYSKQISKFTDNLKLKVGSEMQIDEMEIGSKKSRYNGWFIDAIDTKTRFVVSSEFTKHRNLTECKNVLQRAKNKTDEQIKLITSDGWLAYPKAIQKTFMLQEKTNTKKDGVKHFIRNASKGEGFNYKIERLHNSVRQRIKVCRGFHGSTASANILMKGWEIHYNFIRNHLSLVKTPSELATDVKFTTNNRWLELINLTQNI